MTAPKHHQPGARVSIVVPTGTLPGKVDNCIANVYDDGAPYRLNVVSDDGRCWDGCHPNCILPLDTPEVAA